MTKRQNFTAAALAVVGTIVMLAAIIGTLFATLAMVLLPLMR